MGRLLAIAAVVSVVAASAAQAAAPTPPLGHEGRWITDARGRVAILHGFNMVHKVGSYRPEDTGFGGDDARFLRRHGFNTIRLGIIYKGLEPKPPGSDGAPRYRRGYLRSIARTERVLGRRGIFSLLDFHQDLYNERYQGEGWPDWQADDDGLPAEPQNGFPANYLTMPALNRAYDHFWANDPDPVTGEIRLQRAYARVWKHVAQRFADYHYVVGYDLLNEPWPGSEYPACTNPAGCPTFDATTLTEFSKRVIEAIRKVDGKTLAFYEPLLTFDFGADTAHGDTGDPRAGLSFHNYCLPAGVGFGAPPGGCPELEDLVFQNADDHSEATGDVLFLTEFGASDDLEDTEQVVDLADDHMTSWQYWHYCDCDDPTTSGPGVQSLVIDPAKPPRGDNLKRDKLKVLERPYPRAVSGTPESYSFDPETARFDLTYSTETPAGERLPRRVKTEIYVPRSHYRPSYGVEVEGGVVAQLGKRVVKIKRRRGAREVTVGIDRIGPD